jgi:uncharacterized protein
MPLILDRRAFLTSAGAAWLFGLTPREADASQTGDALFATAFMDKAGAYGLALLTEHGAIVSTVPLPARGHGVATGGIDGWSVAFARRPGTFALAFDASGRQEPKLFHAPEGRHFFGHGLFADSGRLLLATENAFETGDGMIGLYDATDSFRRIGEWSTCGIDPHDMLVLPDGQTLCVANGGILTHPDSGRQKLNLATMETSIAFVDIATGDRRAVQTLPPHLQRLSLRHMALDGGGQVWIGGQFEGPQDKKPPLIARVGLDRPLETVTIDDNALAALSNYVGSVAASRDGRRIAFTSPEGGAAIVIDAKTAKIVENTMIERVCAVASATYGFVMASETGQWANTKHGLAWDNHSAPIK